MPRSVRLLLLAILFAAIAAVELRLIWSTLAFVAHPETVHFRLPMSDQLVVYAGTFGGLRRGDRVVAIDGVAVSTRWQTHRQVIRRPVGAPVRVTVERDGGRIEVEAPTRAWPTGMAERVLTFMQNVVTPWLCLPLGFFIALRRPGDRMAWLVLFMLLGLVQIHAYLFQTDEWNAVLAGLFRLTSPFLRHAGVVAWLWFGLDFCAGRRLFGWLRWPLSLPLLFLSVHAGLESLAGLHFPDWLPVLSPLAMPQWLQLTLTLMSLALGFSNLVYRLVGETEPDTRRRLRVLVAGMVAGRGPMFLLDIAFLFGRPSSNFSVAIWVPAIAAVFLVPVTFAYVLIAGRAMDVGVVVRQGLQYALARRGVDVVRALALLPLVLVEDRWRAIGGSLLALVLAGPLAGRLRSWIDRRFFREAVHAEQVLAGIAEPLRSVTDLAAVLQVVADRVSSALHVTEAATWLAGSGAPPPAWLELPAGETLTMRASGSRGLLGAIHLGVKKSHEPYSPAEVQLLESVAHQAALAMENAALTRAVAAEIAQRERIQRELEIAKDVQARLLPKRDPEIDGLAVAGLCRPAQSIGGDSYDYILTCGGRRLLVTVADVAGKGVPAALLMSNLQAALRGLTLGRREESLAETLGRLNELVFDSTPSNRFITLFALAYDADARSVRYASAGHNPAALLRAGADSAEWIRTKGVALGLRRHSAFAESGLALAPGDTLVLYTDGVTEAVNAAGEEFGEARLAQAILRASALPAPALRDELLAAVDAFAGGAPQHDDITLVVSRAF